jgi:hypothetical protein
LSDRGISFALSGSQRTTFRAVRMALAKRLSSSGERGSMKWTSKAMTLAPSLARISVKRACVERGHLSGLSGRLRHSQDSLSILTTTTSGGAGLSPLSVNNTSKPTVSSRSSPKGRTLAMTPMIPVRTPRMAALDRRDNTGQHSSAPRPCRTRSEFEPLEASPFVVYLCQRLGTVSAVLRKAPGGTAK